MTETKYILYSHEELSDMFFTDTDGDFWETEDIFEEWEHADAYIDAPYVEHTFPFDEVVNEEELDMLQYKPELIKWAIKETFTKEENPEYFL